MSKMTHRGLVTRYSYGAVLSRYKTLLRETSKSWIDQDGHRYKKSDGWCGGNCKLNLETIKEIEVTE
jgi:hypothetical protein